MRETALTAAVILALPLLLAWPLPAVFATEVLAAPDQEAAPHIWGLWAALQTGGVPVIETDLLASPDGVELVLVDPVNLIWFAPGFLLGGVAGGYNAVVYGGLVLMGVAGALLARRVGGLPWLGATLAMACPTLLANAADGMTEGFGVGWVGIQLALLLAFLQEGGAWRGVAAALALAACAYAGPYNAVWAAGIDIVLALALLRRAGAFWRATGVAIAATLLSLPLSLAVLTRRSAALPGSAARAGFPEIRDYQGIFRGGVQTGADLLDLWLPGPLTGGQADVSHTAYLGILLLALAGHAVARERALWPWLFGALAFAALALGPHLYLRGEALRLGGAPLLGPAGLASLALPPLLRMTRWYRAAAVATLLLAALGSRHRRAAPVVALLVIMDVLFMAPLAWPLTSTPPPRGVVTPGGPLLELPLETSAQPPPGAWRDQSVLAQVQHRRPLGGSMMGLGRSEAAVRASARVRTLLKEGALPEADAAALEGAGFQHLALYTRFLHVPPASLAHLDRCLGVPVEETAEARIHALVVAADCRR